MPGKAKVGKQRTHAGTKKRARVTGSGKIRMEKAAHRHRLNQKASRQKALSGSANTVSKADEGRFKSLLWN